MMKSVIETTKLKAASLSITIDGRDMEVDILNSQENIDTLSAVSGESINLKISIGVDQDMKTEDDAPLISHDYVFHSIGNSQDYSGLLKYTNYIEIDNAVLDILNQDWQKRRYIRLAACWWRASRFYLLIVSSYIEENPQLTCIMRDLVDIYSGIAPYLH